MASATHNLSMDGIKHLLVIIAVLLSSNGVSAEEGDCQGEISEHHSKFRTMYNCASSHHAIPIADRN